jgi:hypothetical protein
MRVAIEPHRLSFLPDDGDARLAALGQMVRRRAGSVMVRRVYAGSPHRDDFPYQLWSGAREQYVAEAGTMQRQLAADP